MLENSKQVGALTMTRRRSMERGSSGGQNHGRSKSWEVGRTSNAIIVASENT